MAASVQKNIHLGFCWVGPIEYNNTEKNVVVKVIEVITRLQNKVHVVFPDITELCQATFSERKALPFTCAYNTPFAFNRNSLVIEKTDLYDLKIQVMLSEKFFFRRQDNNGRGGTPCNDGARIHEIFLNNKCIDALVENRYYNIILDIDFKVNLERIDENTITTSGISLSFDLDFCLFAARKETFRFLIGILYNSLLLVKENFWAELIMLPESKLCQITDDRLISHSLADGIKTLDRQNIDKLHDLLREHLQTANTPVSEMQALILLKACFQCVGASWLEEAAFSLVKRMEAQASLEANVIKNRIVQSYMQSMISATLLSPPDEKRPLTTS